MSMDLSWKNKADDEEAEAQLEDGRNRRDLS
jgi:hypothetical protein